jgi:hypothetical protein
VRRLLPLLLLTCSPPPCETCPAQPSEVEVSVCVDSAFDATATEAAHVACDRWSAALCGLVTLVPLTVPGDAPPGYCDVVLYRVRSDYPWVAERSTSTAGYTDADLHAAWIVVDRVPPGQMPAAMAHELGHLLGVSHGDGAMSPSLAHGCIDRRAAVLAALRQGERSELECVK